MGIMMMLELMKHPKKMVRLLGMKKLVNLKMVHLIQILVEMKSHLSLEHLIQILVMMRTHLKLEHLSLMKDYQFHLVQLMMNS